MGARHRKLRSLEKNFLRGVLAKAGKVAPLKEARRVFRDPGYKETEYGELRSTIRKLTEREILDRLAARATFDIQQAEDARVFAEIDEAIKAHIILKTDAERILDGVSAKRRRGTSTL